MYSYKISAKFFCRVFFIALLLIMALFFSACYGTSRLFSGQPVRSQTATNLAMGQNQTAQGHLDFKILTIKSPMFQYYDYALLRNEEDNTIIELFHLGNNIGNIKISKNRICFMNDCAPKWTTVKRFFGKVSYPNMLEDILNGRDIFKSKGKMVGPNNATIQRFQQSGQVIYYERTQGHILFRNLSNGFILALDEYIDPAKQYDGIDYEDMQYDPN